MSSNQGIRIDHNPMVQRYYNSLESRLGYKILLGERRHHGYYDALTYWPFPIDGAMKAMEDYLFRSLALEAGAQVLDAGCGAGHVAIRLAQHGLRVQGIDVVDHHVRKAERSKFSSKIFSLYVFVYSESIIAPAPVNLWALLNLYTQVLKEKISFVFS